MQLKRGKCRPGIPVLGYTNDIEGDVHAEASTRIRAHGQHVPLSIGVAEGEQ